MRVAIVFDVFSDKTRRFPSPFVQAQYLSAVTIANPQQSMTMLLQSVIPQGNGKIHIGAVGYPYRKENHALAIKEVRATKSGKVVHRSSLVSADGFPVDYDLDSRTYKTVDGVVKDPAGVKSVNVHYSYAHKGFIDTENRVHPWDFVKFKFFDSESLRNHRTMVANGKPSRLDPLYVNWMEEVASKNMGHVLDTSVHIGRVFYNALHKVFLNRNFPVSNFIEFPDFFISSSSPVQYNRDTVDSDILGVGRSPGNLLVCERPPFESFISRMEREDGHLHVTFTGVAHVNSPEGVSFKAIDQHHTVSIPDPAGVVVTNYEAVDINTGELVPRHFVLHPLRPCMRIVPYDPSYSSLSDIQAKCSDALVHFIRQQLIAQATPTINGIPSTLMRYVDKQPKDFQPSNVWVRNEMTQNVYDLHVSAFRGEIGNISFDMLHHPWSEQYVAFTEARKSGFGKRVEITQPEKAKQPV